MTRLHRACAFLFSLVLCAASFCAPASTVHAASVIRVAPPPLGTSAIGCGVTWAQPCDLQYTLMVLAQPGDTIWALQGTYVPSPISDANASFVLRPDIAMYGGFAGVETSLAQRNLAANVSILSGDMTNNGANPTWRAYHVVRAENVNSIGAVLDGFTISGGNATASAESKHGGGVYLVNSSLTLSNLIIRSNTANTGGGLSVDGGNPRISEVTFRDNQAVFDGGGAYLTNTPATFETASFINNQAGRYGGGIYSYLSTATIDDVLLQDNRANTGGAGIYHHAKTGIPELLTINNCQFFMNSTQGGGGGMNLVGNAVIQSSTFKQNFAVVDGGAMEVSYFTQPALTNLTIYDNATGGFGGAIAFLDSVTKLHHVTLVRNQSAPGNGVITNNYSGVVSPNLTIASSILWENVGVLVKNANSGAISVDSSVYQASCPYPTCMNTVNVNPNLMPPGDYGGSTPTMPPLAGSVAINMVPPLQCASRDQRGISRPQAGTSCDAGAVESRGYTVTLLGGNDQSTKINTTFPLPLRVAVTSPYGEPVNGGQVQFIANSASGAGLVYPPPGYHITTIVNGVAEQQITANAIPGSYSIRALVPGGSPGLINISLRNTNLTPLGALQSSKNPAIIGDFVTFTATLSPSTAGAAVPTGTVQFQINGVNAGGALPLVNGSASLARSDLALGGHAVSAHYNGDAVYEPVDLPGFSQQIIAGPLYFFLPLVEARLAQ